MSAATAITCPACGGTVTVRAAGFSVNLACVHCGSILDVARPEVTVIRRYQQAAAGFVPAPGTRGELFGEEWEVVGATERADPTATWQEFLLFNPYLGYRWLVRADGEWQFGTPLVDWPQWDSDRVIWRGQAFTACGPELIAVVLSVAGEFYWRLATGDSAGCTLYEAGEALLSRELSHGEENWTHLIPVPGGVVANAFGLPEPAVRPVRRLAGDGPGAAGRPDDLGRMLVLAVVTAIVALFAMVALAGPASVAGGSLQVAVGRRTEPVRIGTITVTRPYQFVTLSARATAFENRWVDLDYSLVDRATQQSIDAYGLIEHYAGTDSDGPWTEGSHGAETTVGQVPRGTYDVYAGAEAHGWPGDPAPAAGWGDPETITLAIDARTGAMAWGMWWALLVALLFWPGLILWWRSRDDD